MTQDITRWVAEIRTLKHQLATAQQERDQAYKSAANWRSLYDGEATQRREEVAQLQLTVETLRTELATLKATSAEDLSALTTLADSEEAADLESVPGLRAELVKILQQCDRLQKALKAEQAAHADTRTSLTTALGEAIDTFNQKAIVRQPGSSLQKAKENE